MNGNSVDNVLVVLNVAPGLDEAVIDWLLGREGDKGFTSYPVAGHSSRHEGLSAAEQVSGRRRRTQFEIHMPRDAAHAFVREASDNFGAADIHCVVVTAMAAGSLANVLEYLK